MTGPVCPSCGVAVMPGYARCPKCRKPLPRRKQTVMGGTAVDSTSRGPLLAILAAAIVGAGIIAYIGLRSSQSSSAAPRAATPTQQTDTTANDVVESNVPDQPETRTNTPAAPDPSAVADRLEKALKRERLWSTVSVEGGRIDVRSGSCSDPKMAGILDGSSQSLKSAGLTRLRCLEQSGQVVSDRDL
ncbi:MAG TPA: hypothetical protein VMZ53_23225 [Kofleriaceae bacterium]|nr:hypothetical protein [Kofleriaceae bacterium]